MNRLHATPVELLIIEDNPGDILLMKEAFKSLDGEYRLQTTTDGEAALELLQKQDEYTPHFILLDLNLPKHDGVEVLKKIKQTEHLKHIPVIVISSSRAPSDIRNSYLAHANGYISKPQDLEELNRMVQAIEGFWFKTAILAH